MPSLVIAPIKITSVSDDSTVNFGDVLQISPKSTGKSYSGAGVSLTGDFSVSVSVVSFTNVLDPDIADSNQVANN